MGSCVSVHTRDTVFSLNSNIKTAQVSPSLPLRQLSTSHHKCIMGCTSNQCLDQGPLQTCFSIIMYILVLTPLHLASLPSFFLLIQGQCFLFSSCSTWSQFFLRCRESFYCIFKWRGKICILFFPESPLFLACPMLTSVCSLCPPIVHRLLSSRIYIPFSPHLSTYFLFLFL